jgi:outer membrane protein OmpA-like peptidoglycan-associated protein
MKNSNLQNNYWISLSDIMTGLMVIFMFIAISYILQVTNKQKERDQILEDFRDNKVSLYLDLRTEFADDFKESKWNAILDEDLSIKFLNEQVLFDYDKVEIKPEFEEILDDFFPRYLKILLSEKYKDKIAEVRIEGHTDSQGEYIYNVFLSQSRTTNVLKHLLFREKAVYNNLVPKDKDLVRFWLTANGYSYGRTIDNNNEFTLSSGKQENRQKSRRVEFRIITKSDEVIKQILKKIEENGAI